MVSRKLYCTKFMCYYLSMCRRVTCERCRLPTYVGCGRHIEQVLGDVPPSERCKCQENLDEEDSD